MDCKFSLGQRVGFFCAKHAENIELGVHYSLKEYSLPTVVFYRISPIMYNPYSFMPTRRMRFRVGDKKLDSVVNYEQLQDLEAIMGKVKLEVPDKLIRCRSLILEIK